MESKDDHRRDLGRIGEEIACDLLRKMGHRILERNYRNGHLEIDIISIDADGIHFCGGKDPQGQHTGSSAIQCGQSQAKPYHKGGTRVPPQRQRTSAEQL